MLLTVNDEKLFLPNRNRISIPELLDHLKLENPAFTTIILNGTPLDADMRHSTVLRDADRIEILQYVAGG
jgi:thiamine biosynthesis protein ThiS